MCDLDFRSGKIVRWKIPHDAIHTPPKGAKKSIFDTLFDTVEWGGNFNMVSSQVCTPNKGCKTVVVANHHRMNRGSASSVMTEDGYCNYHTHPFLCYKGEQTIWGWPSGEDMRENIRYVLKGNVCHFVFTLEGAYRIQVNPNFVSVLRCDKRMRELGKSMGLNGASAARGVIVGLIEAYFKCTHGHRCVSYNEPRERSGKRKCMPSDWVTFANKFTLDNFSNVSKNKCTNPLPCAGFPEPGTRGMSLKTYLQTYDIDNYGITASGEFEHKKNFPSNVNVDKAAAFFRDVPSKLSYDKSKWTRGQWFHVELYPTLVNGKPVEKWAKGKSCAQIYALWECLHKNPQYRSGLRFPNDIGVCFRPIKKGTCSRPDKSIKEWTKGPPSGTMRSLERSTKGPRKRAFGHNPYKR